MHVRARLQYRRIQISLVDTHRVDGKVQQEHIASLGSVPPDMSPADRLAFWTQAHPRLARLGNRIDLAKIMGELHAKVPMVVAGDPGLLAGRIEIAEHNAGLWTAVREHTLATVEEKRELVAKLTTEIAEGEKLAAVAAGHIEEDRRKVERLKAGEDVDVGKPLDFHAILKAAGCTDADIRHMEVVATISESGFKQYVDESQRETERYHQRSGRALARRILRREAAEDEQRHDTPPAPEPE
jgi:hypothetical protein